MCCAVYSDLGFSPLLGVCVCMCVWGWAFFSPATDEHGHWLDRNTANVCFDLLFPYFIFINVT